MTDGGALSVLKGLEWFVESNLINFLLPSGETQGGLDGGITEIFG